jgi:hypothetical protein
MRAKKPKEIQSHCPVCGAGKYAKVLAMHVVSDTDEETGIWGKTTSYMLKCGGCKTVFFHEETLCSEDYDPAGRPETRVTVYPAPAKRKRPDWFSLFGLQPGIYSLLEETYNALDVDARVLSATGARTVFDHASERLKIKPALTFKEKLDELQNRGHISASERTALDILTDAGNAAAHRGWKPTTAQLDTVMSILEAFIHRKFIVEFGAARLKKQIPKRQKRKKKKS